MNNLFATILGKVHISTGKVIPRLRLFWNGCRPNREPGSYEPEITVKAPANNFPILATTLGKVHKSSQGPQPLPRCPLTLQSRVWYYPQLFLLDVQLSCFFQKCFVVKPLHAFVISSVKIANSSPFCTPLISHSSVSSFRTSMLFNRWFIHSLLYPLRK